MVTNEDIALKYFGSVQKRIAAQRSIYITGLIGVIASMIAGSLPLILPSLSEQNPLDERIQTVEGALNSIRDLEEYLREIKADMEKTEKVSYEINQQYEQAKELKKLTDAQLETLKQTLQAETWWRTVLNYILGFILGVASSLLAGVLHSRWKQWRALRSG